MTDTPKTTTPVQYKVMDHPWAPSEPTGTEAMLNGHGQEGWQLASVYPDTRRERTRWIFSSAPSGAGASGIPEAPTDGQVYGRQSAAWSPITSGVGTAGPPGPAGPAGPQGPPGGSTDLFSYTYSSSNTAPPGNGRMNLDTVDQTLATRLWVDDATSDGVNIANILQLSKASDKVFIQDKNDSTSFQVYVLTAAPIDKGTYTELPIAFDHGGTVPLGNSKASLLGVTRVGPSIVSTDAGNQARLGTDSFIFVPHDLTKYDAANPTGYITAAAVPVGSGSIPTMNGAPTAGTQPNWARGDHVHPTDTSRVAKAGDTMTGDLTLTRGGANEGALLFGTGGIHYLYWFNGRYQLGGGPLDILGTTPSSSPSTGALTVAGAGGVGVGGNIYVGGNGYKPAGGPWLDSSDARIKDIVGDYEHGLAEVLALTPRRYRYKGNDTIEPTTASHYPYEQSPHYSVAKDGTEYIGLIAQEVETVMPEMVRLGTGYVDGKTKVDDLRTLDTGALIYALVNAVKELAQRVQLLETKGV